MKYLFDTDAVSFFYDATRIPGHLHLKNRVSNLQDEDVLQISVLPLYEFEYSFSNAHPEQQKHIRNTIRKIEQTFEIIPLKRTFAPIYGDMKSRLKRSKGRKSQEMKKYNIDLMIASTAIEESSVVVGSDRIYEEISELSPRFRFQNWLKG